MILAVSLHDTPSITVRYSEYQQKEFLDTRSISRRENLILRENLLYLKEQAMLAEVQLTQIGH